jgi:hypothetical protein
MVVLGDGYRGESGLTIVPKPWRGPGDGVQAYKNSGDCTHINTVCDTPSRWRERNHHTEPLRTLRPDSGTFKARAKICPSQG